MSSGDTEAIRAAIDANVLTIRDDGTRTAAHVAARAALRRLVARLEAAEQALRREIRHRLTEYEGWAGDLDDAIEVELAATLAAAAPGETEQTP